MNVKLKTLMFIFAILIPIALVAIGFAVITLEEAMSRFFFWGILPLIILLIINLHLRARKLLTIALVLTIVGAVLDVFSFHLIIDALSESILRIALIFWIFGLLRGVD